MDRISKNCKAALKRNKASILTNITQYEKNRINICKKVIKNEIEVTVAIALAMLRSDGHQYHKGQM